MPRSLQQAERVCDPFPGERPERKRRERAAFKPRANLSQDARHSAAVVREQLVQVNAEVGKVMHEGAELKRGIFKIIALTQPLDKTPERAAAGAGLLAFPPRRGN